MNTLIVIFAACVGAGEPAKAADPEDRLLQAELLEVSSGDLEKARGIYAEIAGDEKAPEAARAKAMLLTARVQRKLGQVDAARKTLEDVLKAYPGQRDVARQAQGFLREIRTGRPESADFDWLKEFEKSPEVQQRAFDLAMDLAGSNDEVTGRARRQLLALGSIAVPVIEKLLETTRDAAHRQNLAGILLQSGRYERLPAFLDPARPAPVNMGFWPFLNSVPSLSDDDRKRLVEAAKNLKVSEATAGYRDLILLAAGDFSDLPGKLVGVERAQSDFRWEEWVDDLIARDPGALPAIAARAADPACPEPKRLGYLSVLGRKDAWGLLAGAATGAEPAVQKRILSFFQTPATGPKPASAAKYLEAVARFLDAKDPEVVATAIASIVRGPADPPPEILGRIEKLAGSAENDDLRRESIDALLAWAPKHPEVRARAADLLFAEFHREKAAGRELLGPSAGPGRPPLLPRPPGTPRTIPGLKRRTPGASEPIFVIASVGEPAVALAVYPAVLALADSVEGAPFHRWFFRAAEIAKQPEVIKVLIGKLDSIKSRELKESIVKGCLWPELNVENADRPKVEAFLQSVAVDPSMTPEARVEAIAWPAGESSHHAEWIDWVKVFAGKDPVGSLFFDGESQAKLGRTQAPFDGKFVDAWLGSMPVDRRAAIAAAAAGSPQEPVRLCIAWHYPLDLPAAADIRKLLDDPATDVRTAMIEHLKVTRRVDLAPLFLEVLKRPERSYRLVAIDRLRAFALPEAIEPISKLLDDPDLEVRSQALAALKSIRDTLKERKEWEDIVKGLRSKEGKKE